MNVISTRKNFIFNPDFHYITEQLGNEFVFKESQHECLGYPQPTRTLFERLLSRVKTFVNKAAHLAFLALSGLWTLKYWNYSSLKKCELDICRNAFQKAHLLKNGVIQCGKCNARLSLRSIFGDRYYCSCGIHEVRKLRVIHSNDWVQLVHIDNFTMWRKTLILNNTEHFMYKVKGFEDSFSAKDFLRTIMDVDFRLEWDKTTRDMTYFKEETTKRDIVYWKIRWPPPHLDRDYVFQRRYGKLNRHGIFLVQNNSISHPFFPEVKDVVRVMNYRSVLAISPCKDFKTRGFRFSLLYYENPGEPYTLDMLTWFFKTGLDEFLTSMKNAAISLPKSRRRLKEMNYQTSENQNHEEKDEKL